MRARFGLRSDEDDVTNAEAKLSTCEQDNIGSADLCACLSDHNGVVAAEALCGVTVPASVYDACGSVGNCT